jgi:predicted metal-dependent enzyme (double-stranded beta helix superfamily)
MLDKEQLVADCRAALETDHPSKTVRDVIARAVSDPAAAIAGLGEPTGGGIDVLCRSPELTVINVTWRPRMVLMPHNHEMWAVIGIYAGREDNILWRRLADDADGRIEAAGAKSLAPKDVIAFGPDVIHSVTNPLDRVTGAIHVYGGDFFAAPRSEWDHESLVEKPYDIEAVLKKFGGQG